MKRILLLLLFATGCNADRCPLDRLTCRENTCPECKQPMTVYMQRTTHTHKEKSND